FSKGDSVIQTPPDVKAEISQLVLFTCNYETASTQASLQWYVQPPGTSPRFLQLRELYQKEEAVFEKKYSSKLITETKTFELRISGVSESDSGLYYCALRPTVSLSLTTIVQKALFFMHGQN
ncbi:hypothetical protein XENTR_v10002055, partial [Xenopus tropicalis]